MRRTEDRFGRKRSDASHQRKQGRKPAFARTLIVCEGEKTEPLYFQGLKDALRLGTADVRVIPCSDGTDPRTIVQFAHANRQGFDRVFCVFDGDRPQHLATALDHARRCRLTVILTTPCFEWWLLLHFEKSAGAYTMVSGCSTGDRVVQDLRRHIPDYQKNQNVFPKLRGRLATAIKHAQEIERENQDSGSTDPATRVHELIAFLFDCKQKQCGCSVSTRSEDSDPCAARAGKKPPGPDTCFTCSLI